MGRRVTFTEAQLRRAMKVARQADARAIVEVTADGTIRILPEAVRTSISEVDRWFEANDQG
ncbi:MULTISPECIES: hypothetical protein [unclassified Paracoccus (in: a-proteobacteria)]|uniref:hypothetical protein n=1 Tax=unclassified Paracoccus (in: a-proteobacteria) TaxID=2688777 RepID=UPI0012B3E43E|nr:MULTISPECIES: hypothetical protein [unclassified Paracoccus (in: a-proteobacteria)]UXU73665.1 hypothetical protein GB879_006855 [Paracoccus sp. SMMA_5]UXU79554.1 hypothetical protein GB880_006840 [Paracoccus sp. SMMA_5_TC]